MPGLRERTSDMLVRASVEHAMDSLEIRQRHESIPSHGSAYDSCAEIAMIADFVSRASLWLAQVVSPTPPAGAPSR